MAGSRQVSLGVIPGSIANIQFPTSWTNITPPVAGQGVAPIVAMVPPASYGCTWIAANPMRPNEVWCCVDQLGLWKSTNYGKTFTGGQISPANFGTTTTYFDAPFQIQWDPNNPNHGYCSQGVRGNTQGFWETDDGGNNWYLSAGFLTVTSSTGTRDCTAYAVDPTDFNHVIVGSHSAWTPRGFIGAGILEKKGSTIGGTSTWTIHDPDPSWVSGTQPPHFLYDPATGQGDVNTWGMSSNGSGTWKTKTAGASWYQTSTISSVHGGQSSLYLPDGRLIIGAEDVPLISSDNGETWAKLTNLPSGNYFGVWNGGDGYLYTGRTFRNNDYQDPLYSSPISDAINWTLLPDLYTGDGPEFMTRVGKNFYMVCWTNGAFVKRLG